MPDPSDSLLEIAPPFERIPVLVSDLDLALDNPRFPRDADGQGDAIRLMMVTAGELVVEMLTDILTVGAMNSSDVPIVVRTGGRYSVLEGNRRLTALRLWADPSLLSDSDPTTRRYRTRIERLIAKSRYRRPYQIVVSVAPSAKEANPWIDRKHMKGQGGAGTAQWGAAMKDRRMARDDPSKRSRALAFIELISSTYKDERDVIDALETVREERYSFIQRFIDRPVSRERLGLEFQDGQMSMRFSPADTLPIVRQILSDFARPLAPSGKSWARELNTVKEFEEYLEVHTKILPSSIGAPLTNPSRNSVESDVPPQGSLFPDSGLHTDSGLGQGPPGGADCTFDSIKTPTDATPSAGPVGPPPAPVSSPSATDSPASPELNQPKSSGILESGAEPVRQPQNAIEEGFSRPIPLATRPSYMFRGLDVNSFSTRIQRIIRETSSINVYEKPEVAAVMLRVVLELTCFQFLAHNNRTPENALDKRIKSAIKILEPAASDPLDKAEDTSPLRRAFHSTDSNTIRLAQFAVHSVDNGSTPSETLILVERYTPLLEAMSASMREAPAS